MVSTSTANFAELIAYAQANFRRLQIVELDHTPKRSILVVTCYWQRYRVRITEIVSRTERKYRYYVFDGDHIVAGVDNAADAKVTWLKYGHNYKRIQGVLSLICRTRID